MGALLFLHRIWLFSFRQALFLLLLGIHGLGMAAQFDLATPNWLYMIESVSKISLSDGLPSAVRSPNGNLYVTYLRNNLILQITPLGETSIFAGVAHESCLSIDGGVASGDNKARFCHPAGIAVDPSGNLYIAEQAGDIRKISSSGGVATVTTLAGVANDGCDSIDGEGTPGANTARFCSPAGIAIDPSGNLYVADQAGAVRKIAASGGVTTVTTLAGVANDGCGSIDGEGTPGANTARFCNPVGIAVAPSGSLYVSDNARNTIRKISSSGGVTTVTTLAGVANDGCDSIDGEGTPGANTARFCSPAGIAIDPSGNLYVADRATNKIRKITMAPTVAQVSTVAGTGGTVTFNIPGPLPVTYILSPISVAVVGGNQLAVITPQELLGANLGIPFNYAFSGFRPPVDALPTLNLVKAGNAVPVNFSLQGDRGLNIFASGYPISQSIPCDAAAPTDAIETTVTSGASNLQYDATLDQYTYVWKTDTSWACQCRQLTLKFQDATFYSARFEFR